jgi:hypothetical protein
MVMVNAGGWRVEKVTRTVCDQIPVASLRISWHGYWQADCRTTAEVAEFVDLSTLVPEAPQKWMRAPVRVRWQSASELLGVRVQSTIPSHQLTEVTLGR